MPSRVSPVGRTEEDNNGTAETSWPMPRCVSPVDSIEEDKKCLS